MAETASEAREKLVALYARRQATAGISSTSFSDQRTDFDGEGLMEEIRRLERIANGGGTRLAGFRKGFR